MTKRVRDGAGWIYPRVDNVLHFTLDINSSETYSSAVEFEYNVLNKSGPLYHNGKLNLRAADQWSVALSNFYMPNNFETFPSIDKESNLSAAFHNLQIFTHYQYDDEDYFYTIKSAVNHFPHGNYTPATILDTFNNQLDESISKMCSTEEGGKSTIKEFKNSVGKFYVDTLSNFVHFDAVSHDHTLAKHPFTGVMLSNMKDGLLPHKKSVIKDFLIRSIYIWVGKSVIDCLGEFDFTHLWDSKKQSGITFHGEILDKLIFSYQFAHKTGERPYLISKGSIKRNKQAAVHVKTNLVHSYSTDFGNLAVCAIPKESERNISYVPPKLIWRPLRSLNVEKIKFKLTDEADNLLNYNNGHVEMTLVFIPTKSVVY